MTSSRRPTWKLRLLLVACSTLLALAAAEAGLRLAGIGRAGQGSAWFAGGNHPRFLFQPDAEAGYTLRPGFTGTEVGPGGEFEVTAEVNAEGLRDHPHTAPQGPAVLAVGDSMTFGEGVPVELAFPALLEAQLGVRVVNGGVPGYGSPQMRARLAQLLPRVRPRLVVCSLSPLWDRHRAATPFRYLEGYIVAPGYADRLRLVGGNLFLQELRAPVLGPATAWLKAHSVVMRLALPLAGGAARALLRGSPPPEPSDAEAAQPSLEALTAARDLTAAAGARFVVVLLDSRGPDFERARDALVPGLEQRGIKVIALDERLAGQDWQRLRYPRDGHWNAEGHRQVAAALAPLLRQLLAAPAAPAILSGP